MAEAVPVRCPSCRRENGYSVPVYPCACGSPVAPPLDLVAPAVPITHRNWSDAWVTVRCGVCGRDSDWPHPEVGCGSCGLVVRVPVHPAGSAEAVGPPGAGGSGGGPAGRPGTGVGDGAGDGAPPVQPPSAGSSPAEP
ncbi:hypothetical protein AB0D45_33800, partial [Streptomyces sp. NPDC048352]